MIENDVIEALTRMGAIIKNDHFIYTHGDHGHDYVNKGALFTDTEEISKICKTIAEQFLCVDVDLVVGPALGGIVLSQWTADHLTKSSGRKVLSIFAEKSDTNHGFVFKRCYSKLVPEKRVLIVDDIITTGGSIRKMARLIENSGGQVVGVGAIWNRSGLWEEDIVKGIRFISLVNYKLEQWGPSECPLCKQGIPINTEFGQAREQIISSKKVES